jgi:integrase
LFGSCPKCPASSHHKTTSSNTAPTSPAGKIEPGKARLVKVGSGAVCLHIAGPNSCRWRYSYRHQGKLTTAFWPAIGPAAISEKQAEAERNALWLEHYKQRREARETRKAGLPKPVASPPAKVSAPARGAAPASPESFKAWWDRYVANQRIGWGDRTQTRYTGLVARYCGPIMDKPVMAITVQDIAAILQRRTSRGTPLWGDSESDGRKLRVLIESVLALALVMPNPADRKGPLQQMLPKNTNGHRSDGYAWLDPEQMPAFMAKLVACGEDEHARCLRFQILTTARPEEARTAQWQHIDLKTHTWTLPKAKTKKRDRAFVFYLSDWAMATLGAPKSSGPVFPTITEDSRKNWREAGWLIDWLAEDGRPVTMHGMRKTFETWAESTGRNPFVADAALQHGKAKRMGKVSGKYAKHEYHTERKAILAEWADYTMRATMHQPFKPM